MKPDWRTSRSPKKKWRAASRLRLSLRPNTSHCWQPLRQSFHMGLKKPQRPLMFPVPSRPWQWEGCACPASAHSTTVHLLLYTHPPAPICPGQLGNREQLASGDSRCQEVPPAAQVVWWVGVTVQRKALMSQGREAHADKTVSNVRAGPLGILWSCRVERRRFKMYGHETWETAGDYCQLLATYKSPVAH